MRRAARRAMTLVVSLVTAGCRDGVPPFSPAGLEPGAGPAYQLTFSFGHDRDPRWSTGGDTILYHSDLFGALPRARGILLEVPSKRGTARPVLEDIQLLVTRLLATPAYSPDGTRIAYMDLVRVSPATQCVVEVPPPIGIPESCVAPQPLLDSAALRVRRIGETRGFDLDPSIAVKFAGPDPTQALGLPPPYVQRVHPFQFLHRDEAAMVFRPGWAPDGQQIVFSDGLRVRLWRVGDPAAAAIPGTEDGVSPAWSPDGNWIAFTQLERGDSAVNTCSCEAIPTTGGALHQERRTQYQIRARSLVLIRPDGTGRTVLGEGEEPAWSPNSQQIYVRRGDAIVRVPVQGGAVTAVANTSFGRMPAVSPDGNWLAFARRKPLGTEDYDIWVVSLTQ